MQSDQPTRCARGLAADAGRYAAKPVITKSFRLTLLPVLVLLFSCSEQRAGHYYDEGRYAWDDGKLEVAIANFEKSLEILPNHDDARLKLAQVLAITGKTPRAKEETAYVIENSPENSWAHIILARILTAENRYKEAEESYLRALSIDPDFFLYWEYGKTLLVLGKFEEAQKAFEQEDFSMSGMYKDYHEALAKALEGQEKFEEAKTQKQLAEKAEYYFDQPN